MGEERSERSSRADGPAQIVGILVLTPLLFGVVVALLAGGDSQVPGAILGAVVGFILSRRRRDTYAVTGR